MTDTEHTSQRPIEEPSSGGRLLAGWALVVVGGGMLFAGWWGVSGEPSVARQLAYLVSGGLGGLLTGVIGIAFLVSADVRRDRERLGRVDAAVVELRQMLAEQALAIEDIRQATGAIPPGVSGGNGVPRGLEIAQTRRRSSASKERGAASVAPSNGGENPSYEGQEELETGSKHLVGGPTPGE